MLNNDFMKKVLPTDLNISTKSFFSN